MKPNPERASFGSRVRPGWVVPLLYCLFVGGPTPEAQARHQTPAPEAGEWAPTTVALLQHGHERCSGVSTRIVTYWKKLSGNEASVRLALDRYVLTKATADLAGARRALDIARVFLPRAIVEIDATRGVVLDRLYEAEATLCNLVAQPTPPFATFEEKLLKAKSQVLEVEASLGRILRLPDRKALNKMLQPYMGSINKAADAAQEEVRREFDELSDLSWQGGYGIFSISPAKKGAGLF